MAKRKPVTKKTKKSPARPKKRKSAPKAARPAASKIPLGLDVEVLGRSTQGRRYNWVPELPDHRDLLFAAAAPATGALPTKVDLRPRCSPVFDQGRVGSCTGNALAGALEFLEVKALKDVTTKDEVEDPEYFGAKFAHVSRLFIYYNERVLEGKTAEDSGATLRDGIKSLNKWGVCRESLWRYQPALVLEPPSKPAYAEAMKHRIAQYLKLTTLDEMKRCLAAGYPFAFGFTVFESFETAEVAASGKMPVPTSGERALGGHAVLAVGYDDAAKCLIVRNSWGPKWGERGYFYMPYAIIERLQLARDFWTVRR